MKHLYLMRHADAETAEASGGDDAKRALTKRGIKRSRAMARWMCAHEVKVEAIVTSPLRRARQTAAIARKELECQEPCELQELAGGCSAKELAQVLVPYFDRADRILIIGHQPQLSQLVSLLVTGGLYGRVELKKGALCRVIMEEMRPAKCGFMDMLLSPRFVR